MLKVTEPEERRRFANIFTAFHRDHFCTFSREAPHRGSLDFSTALAVDENCARALDGQLY